MRSLFCIYMGLFASLLRAQDCKVSIRGTVLCEEDGSPASYARVWIPDQQMGTLTDSMGAFVLKGLCPGVFKVEVEHVNYFPKEETWTLATGKSYHVHLQLKTEALSKIEILGNKNTLSQTVTSASLLGEELERTRGESLAEALSNISGVNVVQTGPQIFKPVIHGMVGSRVLILNNEVRQEDQQWGQDHAPAVDPFTAYQLTVVKGVSALQYSTEALGGVIRVLPAPLPNKKGLHGSVSGIGVDNGRQLTTSGTLEGMASKLAWRVQATGKYAGDMHSPNYDLSNTGAREMDLAGTLGYAGPTFNLELFSSHFITTLGILRASHIGNITDLRNALESPVPLFVTPFSYDINSPKQEVYHQLYKLKGKFYPSNKRTISFSTALQNNSRQEFDVRRGGRSNIPGLDLSLLTHTSDLMYEHTLKSGLQIQTGLNSFLQQNKNIPGTGIRPLIPNYNALSGGAFFLLQGAKHWEIGGRLEYKDIEAKKFDFSNNLLVLNFSFLSVAASAGFKTALGKHVNMEASLGMAVRPPNINELLSEGLHHATASIEEGNPELQTEKGLKGIVSLDYHDEKERSAQLSLYSQQFWDYIYLAPGKELRQTIRGAFPVFGYKQTNAFLLGADLDIRSPVARNLYYQAKASGLIGQDLQLNRPLISMPPLRLEHSLELRTHEVGRFTHIYVEAGTIHVKRQDRTNLDLEIIAPPEGYHLLKIASGCLLRLSTDDFVNVHLQVDNLLNTTYRDYLNRLRYFAEETGRVISLRIKYSF